MKIVLDLSEKEIQKISEAVGFPSDPQTAKPEEVEQAIHTLIEVCM